MHTKLKATFPENSLGALYKKISSKTNGYWFWGKRNWSLQITRKVN
jgi:hypothetical protein